VLKHFRSWHAGLSAFGKTVFGGAVGLSLLGVIASANHPKQPAAAPTAAHGSGQVESDATAKPTITTRTTTETQDIPFTTSTVSDASLDSGKTVVRTPGMKGVHTITYQITYTNGVQTDKKVIKEEDTTPAVNQVNAVGTKVAATAPAPKTNCDPNYDANRGACVPIASDVDCAGGSGNGPAYVSGPVYVIGQDIYDLDRDGNGVGCQ
jgi:hypothetical protein